VVDAVFYGEGECPQVGRSGLIVIGTQASAEERREVGRFQTDRYWQARVSRERQEVGGF
jgi:hypothetical protein